MYYSIYYRELSSNVLKTIIGGAYYILFKISLRILFVYYLIVYVSCVRYYVYYKVYYNLYYNLYYNVYYYVYYRLYNKVYNKTIRLIFRLLTIYRVTKLINSKYYLLIGPYLDPRFTNSTKPRVGI